MVLANDGAVGTNGHDRDVVDLTELGILGHGRAGHARELLVHEEVVLERDGRERLVLLADGNALLRLDGLVQALGVAPALHDAAGELVDDLHLSADDHVLAVAVEHVLGLESLLEVVHELARGVRVDVIDAEGALDLGQPLVGRGDGVLGLVHLKVNALGQAPDGTGEVLVGARRPVAGAGDDERGPRLVDEDRVGLVDDRVEEAALDAHVGPHHHVVAQVVKAELGVGAVGDVSLVGGLLCRDAHAVLNQAHRHVEEAVDLAHPLAVAPREVVVHGHDVHALAGNRVEVAGERRDERLALARQHLGDRAPVQSRAAHELDVKVAEARRPDRRLAHRGKGLGEEVVERLARGIPLAEDRGHRTELVVGHCLEPGLQLVHALGDALELLAIAI